MFVELSWSAAYTKKMLCPHWCSSWSKTPLSQIISKSGCGNWFVSRAIVKFPLIDNVLWILNYTNELSLDFFLNHLNYKLLFELFWLYLSSACDHFCCKLALEIKLNWTEVKHGRFWALTLKYCLIIWLERSCFITVRKWASLLSKSKVCKNFIS